MSITPKLIDTFVAWTENTVNQPLFTHQLPEALELGFVHTVELEEGYSDYTKRIHDILVTLIPSRPITVGSTVYQSKDRIGAVHIRMWAGKPLPPPIEVNVIHSYGEGGQQNFHTTYIVNLPLSMQAEFLDWAKAIKESGHTHYGIPSR